MSPHDSDGFNFAKVRQSDPQSITEAIHFSVFNYFRDQLGLSEAFCKERCEIEEQRIIPKNVLRELETLGWKINGSRILDVGAGQGAMVLELLEQGADALAIEPSADFSQLAKMRLASNGHNPNRVRVSGGQTLPFESETFDYVVNLQVLEHVRDPSAVVREMFRILKPGGRLHMSCENYLYFREAHYRVFWIPLLPKYLGQVYLKSLGRNPSFLLNHIYYTTYPQIWHCCRRAGFKNLSLERFVNSIFEMDNARSSSLAATVRRVGSLSTVAAGEIAKMLFHIRNSLSPLIIFELQRPE